LAEIGINGRALSYTRSMEKNTELAVAQTAENKQTGILLSATEAEEYRNFKRQKYIASVNENIRKVSLDLTDCKTSQEIVALCTLAKKYSLASVRTTPDRLSAVQALLAEDKARIDVLIGGTGKTLVKVKTREAKLCLRGGAGELTLMPNPSFLVSERFSELKKEVKKLLKKAKNTPVKVFLSSQGDLPKLFRLSRLFAELGVGMSVPYFLGVERLKLDDKGACALEVREVDTVAEYQKMIGAGVERIQTSHLTEIYAALMKEAENYSFSVPVAEVKTVVPAVSVEPVPLPPNSEQAGVERKNEKATKEEKENEKAEVTASLSAPLTNDLKEDVLEKAEAYRAILEEIQK